MAEVLLGRLIGPSGFERIVVLKRILPHLARQSSFVDMFLDEARIIARINHPNVVQVHDLGSADGELFMVMEYLEGESVSSLQRRLTSRHERLAPRLAAFIIAEACAGLHAAHELTDEEGAPIQIVHRDVSPQNIFLTFNGAVKVIDFGVAKSSDRVTRTETGQLKGKLDYMAPEQCKCEPVDRRTDVFALGVVFYELLTRRRLFKRPSPAATVQAIMQDPVVPPSRIADDCPPAFEKICLRALERDGAKRYATAFEMRRELVAAMAERPSGQLPEEELATLMQTVLSDRREQKAQMLQRIRDGSNIAELPSPEADESVELDVVVARPARPEEVVQAGDLTGVNVSRPLLPPARMRWPAMVLTAALGATLALVWVRFHDASRPSASTPAATAPAAPAPVGERSTAPSTPAAEASVHVLFESDPPGASVVVDGTVVGTTPAAVALARGDDKRALVLRKDGFVDDREDFAPSTDQKLRFFLKRTPKTSSLATPARHTPGGDAPAKW